MERAKSQTEELTDALVAAARRLPREPAKVVALLERLAGTGEPQAALAALPLVWESSDDRRSLMKPVTRKSVSPFSQLRQSIGAWTTRTIPVEVTTAAYEAIHRLLSEMPAQALPALDYAIRRMGSTAWVIGAARDWTGVAPPFPSDVPDSPARVQLLGLLASHGDGYVREAAVVELARSSSGEELPFLLWRTMDWVGPVRDKALAAVRDRLRVDLVPAFVRLLPLIRRLELVERVDLSPLLADVRHLLLREPGHASLIGSLRSADRVTRREACRVFDGLSPIPPAEVLDLVGRDDDVVVRSHLLTWEERLRGFRPEQAVALRMALAHDPSSRIRSQALQAMVDTNDDDAPDVLRGALFDSSAFVRYVARFYLHKRNAETDFAAVYRGALSEVGKQSAAAIAGLSETGAPSDCALILTFLGGTPRQARAALKAAAKLDAPSCHDALVQALGDKRDGVCRAALALLARRLPEDDAGLLDQLWSQATTPAAHHALAAAMLRLPPWPAALALLRAVISDRGSAAASALARWRPEHKALYAPLPPPESLRGKIAQALAAAGATLSAEIRNRVQEALRLT
jgi:hypothetical protein